MLIIGCDYHPSFQQIAFMDTETGDYGGQRLDHMEGAGRFYRDLRARGMEARVGMEASGYARWFEQLMAELGFDFVGTAFRDHFEALTQPFGTVRAARRLVLAMGWEHNAEINGVESASTGP